MVWRGLSCTRVVDTRGLDSSLGRRVAGAVTTGSCSPSRAVSTPWPCSTRPPLRAIEPVSSSPRTTMEPDARPRRRARWSGGRRPIVASSASSVVPFRVQSGARKPRGATRAGAFCARSRGRAVHGSRRHTRPTIRSRRFSCASCAVRVRAAWPGCSRRVTCSVRCSASAVPHSSSSRPRGEWSGWRIRRTRRTGSYEIGFATTSCRHSAA